MSRQSVIVNHSINDKKEHDSCDESAIARLRGTQCLLVRVVSKALNFIIYSPRRFTKIISASSSNKVLIISVRRKVWIEHVATLSIHYLYVVRVSCCTDRRMNVYIVNLILVIRHSNSAEPILPLRTTFILIS